MYIFEHIHKSLNMKDYVFCNFLHDAKHHINDSNHRKSISYFFLSRTNTVVFWCCFIILCSCIDVMMVRGAHACAICCNNVRATTLAKKAYMRQIDNDQGGGESTTRNDPNGTAWKPKLNRDVVAAQRGKRNMRRMLLVYVIANSMFCVCIVCRAYVCEWDVAAEKRDDWEIGKIHMLAIEEGST